MTAPIDIECPFCAASAGNYCTVESTNPQVRQRITFHHAERIDRAFRQTALRHDDPRALRDALREAVKRLAKHQAADADKADADELSFIITTRAVFDL